MLLHQLKLTTEWWESAEANVKDHSQTPHVNCLSVLATLEDFRCSYHMKKKINIQVVKSCSPLCHFPKAERRPTIAGCSTDGVVKHTLSDHLGESEIRDLDSHVILVHDQYVLGLEIAVDNTTVVQILDSLQNLPDDVSRLLLCELLLVNNLIEQLAIISTVEDGTLIRSGFMSSSEEIKVRRNLQLCDDVVVIGLVENVAYPEEIDLAK